MSLLRNCGVRKRVGVRLPPLPTPPFKWSSFYLLYVGMLLFKISFCKGFFREELQTTNLTKFHFRNEETDTEGKVTLQPFDAESELECRFLDSYITVLCVISSYNTSLWPVWEWWWGLKRWPLFSHGNTVLAQVYAEGSFSWRDSRWRRGSFSCSPNVMMDT